MIIDDKRLKLYKLTYEEIVIVRRAYMIIAYQELLLSKRKK